jgi:iron complex outermembrane receptor protein
VASYLNHERRRIPQQLTHRLTTVDLDAQQSMTLPRHVLVWGGGATVNGIARRIGADRIRSTQPHLRVNNLYVQDEMALRPQRVYLTGGVKYEHNAFSGGEWQPNVRARWVSQRQTVWGSVGARCSATDAF